MSFIIGLTGPTGSGKSSFSEVAKDLDIKAINCDLVARKAVLPGTSGLAAVAKAFGDNVLLPSGELDRKALAKAAFSSRENTELLNKTLLPHIVELIMLEIEGEAVLLDAPTLFESGLQKICDKTVAVLADSDIRLERIMARDKIDKESALLRMNAGKQDEFYIENADIILYNNKDKEQFSNEAKQVLKNIIGGIK